jgi:hypothetical protein
MAVDKNTIDSLNNLKRHIFSELLNLTGRVFIIVRYHEDVKIGNRGFLPEEKDRGIVLVFNKRMNFIWHEWGIEAKLVFGSTVEECVIPIEHIIGIYSPEANTQFLCLAEASAEETITTENRREENNKVVRIDFKKKKNG